jgi:hypothetical protein
MGLWPTHGDDKFEDGGTPWHRWGGRTESSNVGFSRTQTGRQARDQLPTEELLSMTLTKDSPVKHNAKNI